MQYYSYPSHPLVMISLVIIILSSLRVYSVNGFIHSKYQPFRAKAIMLHANEDETNNDGLSRIEFSLEDNVSNSYISKSLKKRQKDLQEGIGKRYMVRTQRGFLNVHSDTRSVYETDNVVGRLEEGQIVTSIAPNEGEWVKHNEGGWSIRFYEGFTWLVEIDSYPFF